MRNRKDSDPRHSVSKSLFFNALIRNKLDEVQQYLDSDSIFFNEKTNYQGKPRTTLEVALAALNPNNPEHVTFVTKLLQKGAVLSFPYSYLPSPLHFNFNQVLNQNTQKQIDLVVTNLRGLENEIPGLAFVIEGINNPKLVFPYEGQNALQDPRVLYHLSSLIAFPHSIATALISNRIEELQNNLAFYRDYRLAINEKINTPLPANPDEQLRAQAIKNAYILLDQIIKNKIFNINKNIPFPIAQLNLIDRDFLIDFSALFPASVNALLPDLAPLNLPPKMSEWVEPDQSTERSTFQAIVDELPSLKAMGWGAWGVATIVASVTAVAVPIIGIPLLSGLLLVGIGGAAIELFDMAKAWWNKPAESVAKLEGERSPVPGSTKEVHKAGIVPQVGNKFTVDTRVFRVLENDLDITNLILDYERRNERGSPLPWKYQNIMNLLLNLIASLKNEVDELSVYQVNLAKNVFKALMQPNEVHSSAVLKKLNLMVEDLQAKGGDQTLIEAFTDLNKIISSSKAVASPNRPDVPIPRPK